MARTRDLDKKQLQVLIDTTDGVDKLSYLQEQYRRLAEEAEKASNQSNMAAATAGMAQLEQEMATVRKELGLQGMTVNQLNSYYRQLRTTANRSSQAVQKQLKITQKEVLKEVHARTEGMDRQSLKQEILNEKLRESIRVNGVAGLSLEQLRHHHRNLTQEIAHSTAAELKANKQRIIEAQKVDRLIKNRQRSISGTSGIFSRVSAYLPGGGGLLGAFGGAGAIAAISVAAARGIGKLEDAYQSALIPLQNITSSQAEYLQILGYLDRLASDTGQDVYQLAGAYKTLYAAGKAANFGLGETNRLFSAVVRAGATLKLSNEEVEGSIRALEQMINKGTVSSEELRGQLGDRLPGAYALFAKAIGVSTEKLGDMLKNGEIIASETLPKFARELENAFGSGAERNLETISGSANKLRNEFRLLLVELDDNKVTRFWSSFNNGIADTLRDIRFLAQSDDWKSIFDIFTGNLGSTVVSRIKRIGDDQIGRNLDNFRSASPEDRSKKIESLNAKFQTLNATSSFYAQKGFGAAVQTMAPQLEAARKILDEYKKIDTDLRNAPLPGSPEDKDKDKAADKEAKRLADLALARIENAEKTAQEIYKLNIAAIEDEFLNKKAKILSEVDFEAEEKRKLVLENKLTLEDFNNWKVAADEDAERRIAEEQLKINEKVAKEKEKLENGIRLRVLDAALTEAENSEDKKAVLLATMAIRSAKYQIDLQKATEEEKVSLYRQYLADIAALQKGFDDKEKADHDKAVAAWLKKRTAAAEKRKDHEIDSAKAVKEAQDELYKQTADAILGIYLNRLEAQEQRLSKSHDRESAALELLHNNNKISDKKYRDAKLALEIKQDREMAEIKRKQAIAEKAQALAAIAINTAVAVTKSLAFPAAIPFIIGAGVAQAAVVATQPIPSFYYGGDTSPFSGGIDAKGGFLAINHPNEYMVPEFVTSTPEFTAIKPMLETLRGTGGLSAGASQSQTPGTSSSSDFAGLPSVISANTETNKRLIATLKNLRVYFGNRDYEKLSEGLEELEKQQKASLIK